MLCASGCSGSRPHAKREVLLQAARCLETSRFARLCFHVRRDLLTEFQARIPFESFSGLSPTSVDPNAFGVGRDPAWGRRRGEVQWVERPVAGECQRGDKQPASSQQGGPRPEPFSRRAPDDAAYGHGSLRQHEHRGVEAAPRPRGNCPLGRQPQLGSRQRPGRASHRRHQQTRRVVLDKGHPR